MACDLPGAQVDRPPCACSSSSGLVPVADTAASEAVIWLRRIAVAFPLVHPRMVAWRKWWSFVASAPTAAPGRQSASRRRRCAAALHRVSGSACSVVPATALFLGEAARFPRASSRAPAMMTDAVLVSKLDAGESSSLKHLRSRMFQCLSSLLPQSSRREPPELLRAVHPQTTNALQGSHWLQLVSLRWWVGCLHFLSTQAFSLVY